MQMDGNSDTSYQLVQDFAAKAQEELGKSNVAVQRVLAEPAVKQILLSSPAPIIIPQPVQVVMQPAGTGDIIWTQLIRLLGLVSAPPHPARPEKRAGKSPRR